MIVVFAQICLLLSLCIVSNKIHPIQYIATCHRPCAVSRGAQLLFLIRLLRTVALLLEQTLVGADVSWRSACDALVVPMKDLYD